MEKVATVVLNYNSANDCRKCVEYLTKQKYPENSIIVVDNASSAPGENDELALIKEQFNVTLIKNKKNAGFSAGNNIGLRCAVNSVGADWCLVINPDVEIKNPDYIERVIQESRRWEDAVVIGTDVILPSGRHQNPIVERTLMQEIFWPGEMIKRRVKKNSSVDIPLQTSYCEKVSGCCFFIKASFLEEIDFFDENVFLYCEEPILASQVKHKGYKELFIPELTAYHEHYEKAKSGKRSSKMATMINSRIYWIRTYSDYGDVGKKIAIFSKRLQKLFWKIAG